MSLQDKPPQGKPLWDNECHDLVGWGFLGSLPYQVRSLGPCILDDAHQHVPAGLQQLRIAATCLHDQLLLLITARPAQTCSM